MSHGERLDSAGVRFLLDIDPKGTERHLNLMDENGGRISIYVAFATLDPDLDLERLEAAIAKHDVLVLGINNYCRRLIPLAQGLDRPIWCDIHDYDGHADYHRDFVEAADVLFLSSDQLPGYRDFMEAQVAAGKSLVVCTHGRQGASVLSGDGQWAEQPIAGGFERVDTNGAGDAFFAGFLSSWLDGKPVRRCLEVASVVAGLCVTSRELASAELSPARIRAELERLGW
ncbi:MAG: carbohydrate kinase family protein [bacterium]|nr:carbohydrate kinase family protein [bacterium]